MHIFLGISLLVLGMAAVRTGILNLGDPQWQMVAYYSWLGVSEDVSSSYSPDFLHQKELCHRKLR